MPVFGKFRKKAGIQFKGLLVVKQCDGAETLKGSLRSLSDRPVRVLDLS